MFSIPDRSDFPLRDSKNLAFDFGYSKLQAPGESP